jgi:effector-binding domain-containing protein
MFKKKKVNHVEEEIEVVSKPLITKVQVKEVENIKGVRTIVSHNG